MASVLYLIIALIIVCLSYFAYQFIKLHGHPFKKIPPEFNFRVLIALRRRAAFIGQIMGMQDDERVKTLQELEQQWQLYWESLSEMGSLKGGFKKSEHGLSASGDEEWSLIAFLDISGYKIFRDCHTIMDSPEFRHLKNYCDIRLIMGNIVKPNGVKIQDLF